MKNVLFDLVIGRPALKRLGGVLDFRAKEVSFSFRDQHVVVPVFPEYTQTQKDQDGTDSEEFTSNFSADDTERDVEIDEQELVLKLYEETENSNATVSPEMNETDRDETIRQQLHVKLKNLSEETETQSQTLSCAKM